MARGGHVSPVATMPVLPKVSFQKIQDDISTQPSGVHDGQARSFGYNDFSDFHRPDQYIRHIEPLEIDLERQVEYDMDEQDQEWLDAVNAERKKEQLDKVTYEVFEVVMDRLEKEWFNLTKHIPKPDLALPSEDSTCAICDDSEGENSNAIVFCDGCNLAVHQDCYGIPYIPEGQWLCRKCTVSPENPVSCALCPNEGGAFKQTTQGEWIHLLCAIWVPETRVSNDVFMEPIIGVDTVSKQRWKLKCQICGTREGACIQCGKSTCFLAFHVTCARKEKLLLPMKSAQGVEPGALTAFCDKHLPKEQAAIREAAQQKEEEDEDDPYKSAQLSKSARAYAKTYKPGPPLVPAIIIDRILQYISRTKLRKKPEFVATMCKYWSLKREARRGAPLLKRLHLEPWTASTGSRSQGEEEKVMKLEQLRHLRKDLEDLRGLTELSRKRETRKLRQAELIYDFLGSALFVHLPKIREAFNRITGLDRNDYFKLPVNKKDVPDYFDIVKKPMSWSEIESKLDDYQYWDIQCFKDDIQLVLDNAVLYNKHGTPFQKTALRIQIAAQPILAELDHLSPSPNLRTTEQIEGSAPPWTPPPIGDLEPPLEILELLVSSEVIQDESELILSADPITSLFNFELENRKPAPPPPTPPPDEREEKNRKRREADRLRRAADREKRALEKAEAEASLSSSDAQTMSAPPGLRVPRTRGAIAAAVAFETEASARASSSISALRGRPKGSTNKNKLPPPASPSASSRATRQRQPSAPLPAPGDIPLVENIDEKGSFTMFEQGWILPPGHRRGGRVPLERTTAPPPKKKIRLDGGTSRLSVFSTAASDNQTLQTGSPPLSSRAATDADNSMDVDEGERPPRSKGKAANISVDSGHLRLHSLPMVTPERVTIPPPNVIRTPDGQVILEELDTPAIRKEKLLRRKEERAAKAAAAADAASSSQSQMEIDDAEPLSPVPPSPVDDVSMANAYAEADADADADVDTDGDSDLSDLSEIEADPDPGPSKPRPDADGDQEMPNENQEPPDDAPGEGVEPADEPAEGDVGHEERIEPGENVVGPAEVDAKPEERTEPRENVVYLAEGDTELEERTEPGKTVSEPSESVEPGEGVAEPAETVVEPGEGVAELGEGVVEPGEAAVEPGEAVVERGEAVVELGEAVGEPGAVEPSQAIVEPGEAIIDVATVDPGEAIVDNELAVEPGEAVVEPDQGVAAPEEAQPQKVVAKPQERVIVKRTEPVPSASAPRLVAKASRVNMKDAIWNVGRVVVPQGRKRLEPGTLVWAKAVSFPWWPALVYDDTDAGIPPKVLAEAQAQRKKRKGQDWLYIVRFWDKTKSWQYLPLDKMRELGEIRELDLDFLSKQSQRQKKSDWKGSLWQECQTAYAEAMDEMESGDEKTRILHG